MARGLNKINIIVGEESLTRFGGIFLIQRFCKKLKLKILLQKKIQFHQRASTYHPTDLIIAIIFAIIVGINRLSKTKMLQQNGVFQKIIGIKGFPYASSLRRFLKRSDQKVVTGINRINDQLRLKIFYLPHPRTNILLDFDSTAVTVYGKLIEGAKVGYNPGKKGKRSYHPLVCFEYHTKDFWHGVLRPGNAYTAAGSPEFLQECLAKVPPYIYRIRVRADSGFFDHKFIEPLDGKSIGYAIVAKLTGGIKKKLPGLRYRHFREDWSAAEFRYTPMRWKTPHRFVVIRRRLPDKPEEQPTLFTLERYSYQIFVTNLPLEAHNIWYFYRYRASIEIHIKELKLDFFLTKIPTNSFLANQIYFSLLLLSYNIINWFKRLCLPEQLKNATLDTIRRDILVFPARLTKYGNINILKLPAAQYLSNQLLNQIIRNIEKLKI